MNRRTFIQASAAAAVLAATSSPAVGLGQVLGWAQGLPRLHFFDGPLPAHAKLGLLPAQREQILQYGRVLALRSGALLVVDRGTGTAEIASAEGKLARRAGVWDAAELGDGTLLVATKKQGLLRTDLDFKTLDVFQPHDDVQMAVRVAAAGARSGAMSGALTGQQWVAYVPTTQRVLSSGGRAWAPLEELGLRSVKDIVGLDDGRFVVADAVSASVVLTDGHTREVLASYRDRHGDPVAPLALLKAQNGELWVRTTAPAHVQIRGLV